MPRPSKYPLMTVTVSAPICELERTLPSNKVGPWLRQIKKSLSKPERVQVKKRVGRGYYKRWVTVTKTVRRLENVKITIAPLWGINAEQNG